MAVVVYDRIVRNVQLQATSCSIGGLICVGSAVSTPWSDTVALCTERDATYPARPQLSFHPIHGLESLRNAWASKGRSCLKRRRHPDPSWLERGIRSRLPPLT